MSRLILLELKLLLRGWTAVLGVALIVAAGLFAIAHGRTVIARQEAAIARSPALQAEEQRAILDPQPRGAPAGDQLYYLSFHTVREPSRWAPVAVGQRDIQPFNLKVRILALQGQLYDAELASPLLAAFGNFDLAFVLVVLTPLLVIALTFNVWSAEREGGTWDLVRAQPARPARVLALKLALRACVAWFPVLPLQAAATIVLDLPLDARWIIVAASLAAYVCFCAAASVVVTGLRQSSDTNILALLGVWIVATVLGPALITVAAAARFPLQEAMELTVLQRQGYHSAWDEPLTNTMAAFYRRYPEWQSVPIPADRYSNGWYYAMQQRGDDAARDAAERYRRSLVQRDGWIGGISWWLPPAALQRALSRTAGTDLDAYLRYLDSVADYHESLKRHFFPVVFSEMTVADVDWTAAPRHRHADR